MNLCANQSLAENSCFQNILRCSPSLGGLSTPKTLGLVTTVALVVLASIAALVGGTACAVWTGGVVGGLVGLSIALVSSLVLIFSAQTLYCLLREMKCGGTIEPIRASSPISKSSEMFDTEVEARLDVPSMFDF